jgi:hypothetical protein
MTVHVVIREDQNEHGFVDAGVTGLFRSRHDAETFVASSTAAARQDGLRVWGHPETEADCDEWDVSWTIESHPVV